MTKFTEDQDTIIKEYLGGSTVASMASKRHISREAIYQVLRRIENWQEIKDIKKKARQETHKDIAKFTMQQIRNGEDVKDILQEQHISTTTLYRYYPELKGLKRRKSNNLTKSIAEDWMNGMLYTEIAQKYNMYKSNVQRRIKAYYKDDWQQQRKKRKENKRLHSIK